MRWRRWRASAGAQSGPEGADAVGAQESSKFSEGAILSKSMEVLFRAVPPSLYLAMAMTEPEEEKPNVTS